jgi:hypothetical protein
MPLRHTGGGEVQYHLFFTSALDEGQCPTSLPGCFTPRKELLLPNEEEAGSAPQLVWTVSENRKFLTPDRIPTPKVQLVACCYTYYTSAK